MLMMRKSFRFGSFALDLERLSLDGPSGHADLRRKSFDVLRYLVEHAGRVVTKEELIKAVWPDVTVSDDSLTQCISEVRHALGEESHRFIKTVPKHGYVFIGNVLEADEDWTPGPGAATRTASSDDALSRAPSPARPYKFLDYYDDSDEDARLFFGRDRETIEDWKKAIQPMILEGFLKGYEVHVDLVLVSVIGHRITQDGAILGKVFEILGKLAGQVGGIDFKAL
jgi:DNA-binding winged helix-turn-helix (wHTH) protein